jgi:hypothetical protein
MFLASFVWALANVTTNITANSISAANDMTSLAPKYINIKRGQMIAVTVGVWGFAPWKVLATAANFLTFMASYSIVLAPLAALMAVDFFVVKRQRIDIYQLYRPHGIYRFTKGWNWRSYVALICAVAPNMPGMVNAIDNTIQIGNIKYVYMVSNIAGDTSKWRRIPRTWSQLTHSRHRGLPLAQPIVPCRGGASSRCSARHGRLLGGGQTVVGRGGKDGRSGGQGPLDGVRGGLR